MTKPGLALLLALVPACAPRSPHEGPVGERKSAMGGVSARVEAFTVVLEGPSAAERIPPGVDPRSPEAALATRGRIREIEAEHAAIEPALAQHGAEVIARLSRLANAIEILADEATARRIEGLPGVRRVERTPVVHRMLGSAVPLIGGPKAWAASPMIQGDGVTIGVIDSGIDYTHADFGGPGTTAAYLANDSTVIEPGSFPTSKVVGGWDFVGDAYNPSAGNSTPKADPDPLDCTTPGGDQISGGHGTHVAGIAAGAGVLADGTPFLGPYEQSFDPTAFRVAPGVAPRASLYAFRIFGCEGSTTMLNAALDRAADPNNDGSFADRLDVVNLSLGSSYGLGSSTQAKIVSELSKVGTVIVAAAGNEGQNYFVTGSPASYPEVLSVAATVDNDLLTLEVKSPASAVADYAAAEAVFTARLATVGPISGEVVAVSPALGCTAFTNAAQIAGKIAIVDRGTCPFAQKLGNAADAGAIAAIVVDNEDMLLPFSMGGADPGTVPIPGVMVRLQDGLAIQAALAQSKVTVAIDPEKRFTGPGAELLAGLSSRGPSPTDGRFKPEVAAPGVFIDSAGVGTGADPTNKSGTSMASPMVAGAAALVRQARPNWSPFAVKAALVNTGFPLAGSTGVPYGTSAIGGGRVDVVRATTIEITAAADPETGEVGVSFGAVIADEPTTVKRTFVIENHGATPVTLDAAVTPKYDLPGVSVSVSPAQVQVAAAESATVDITLSLDPAALGNPGTDPGVPATQGGMNPTARHFINESNGLVQLSPPGGAPLLAIP